MTSPTHTPAKNPMHFPTKALERAIEAEWNGQNKFITATMPLTALLYTAIDRIDPQRDAIVEALLVYADTDTLCYLSPDDEDLQQLQEDQWGPVIDWSSQLMDVAWVRSEGIMPEDQSEALHSAMHLYLSEKDSMVLAALSVLSGGYSSLILAQAVVEKRLTADEAYQLSCLEETHNAKRWGRDEERDSKSERVRQEMLNAGRFLMLLDA